MRRQLSSKSSTYTESMDVDAAGISVKVSVHYPGRSVGLLLATVTKRKRDEPTEVSRRHSRHRKRAPMNGEDSPCRRPEHVAKDRDLNFGDGGGADGER